MPLGLYADSKNQLWVLDGARAAVWSAQKLYQFDIATGKLLKVYTFPASVAEPGSYLSDLVVSPNGARVYIANSGQLSKKPALIVLDIKSQLFRRTLVNHDGLKAQDYALQVRGKTVRLAGIKPWRRNFNGLALHPNGRILAMAAMNNDSVYAMDTAWLSNQQYSDAQIARSLRRWQAKPANESLVFDPKGRLYLTDVEHGAIMRRNTQGKLETLIQDYEYLRWANGLAMGQDGYLYATSSGLEGLIGHYFLARRSNSPYYVIKIKYNY
jgi:sugar lactone lactonase YvrE